MGLADLSFETMTGANRIHDAFVCTIGTIAPTGVRRGLTRRWSDDDVETSVRCAINATAYSNSLKIVGRCASVALTASADDRRYQGLISCAHNHALRRVENGTQENTERCTDKGSR
jgi:hypothetical protein